MMAPTYSFSFKLAGTGALTSVAWSTGAQLMIFSCLERTDAVVKPRTLGREITGSSPQSPFVVALSKSHIHSFWGNDQKLIVSVTSKKKRISNCVVWQTSDLNLSRNTLYLLSPRLCFFIVLKRDLFVYRDYSLTS